MRHLFVIYIAVCGIIPFFYQLGPTSFYLFGVERDLWYFIRDIIAISGCFIVAMVSQEKDSAVRHRVVKTIAFQTALQFLMLLYNNCEYDPWGNLINAMVIFCSIVYIYRNNKAYATTNNK